MGGFLGGLFLEEFFWMNSLLYLNVIGIDLFVKIFVFFKILSESTRKEGRRTKFRSLEVQLQVHCT